MGHLFMLTCVVLLMLPISTKSASQTQEKKLEILKTILRLAKDGKLPQQGTKVRDLLDKFTWVTYYDVWYPPGTDHENQIMVDPPELDPNIIDDSNRKCGGIQTFQTPLTGDFDGNNIPGTNDKRHCGLKVPPSQPKTASLWKLLRELSEDMKDEKSLFKEKLQKIIGGDVAQEKKWQFLAAIEFRSGAVFGQECGGALIDDQWILTAAHCFQLNDVYERPYLPKEYNTCDMRVVLREFDLTISKDDAITLDVTKVFIHPDYQPIGTYNDIALLKLAEKVDYVYQPGISPICLPKEGQQLNPGVKCWAVGWGLIDSYAVRFSAIVREVQLDILRPEDCHLLDPNIKDNQLCVGVLQGGKDTCAGDSGGPLFCEVNGRFYQFGITSWGPKICGYPGTAAIYTEVSKHLPWIETVIRDY